MLPSVKCLTVWFLFLSMSQVVCVCIHSGKFDMSPLKIWQEGLNDTCLNQMNVTEEAINSAIHDYGQSSLRVWNMFQKVLKGQSIKMIVIGGSNSAGGGIPNHKQLYHQLFLQWWSRVILPCTNSRLTVENLSLGGTGSDFFNFCLQNYLLNDRGPDLVLIELSVNDYGYFYGRAAEPIEQLTRRVLMLSSKPFVMYVTLVDLIEKVKWWKGVPNPRCLNLEDLGQHEIARYYNITILSWRDVVCPMNSEDSKRRIKIKPGMINKDHLHIGVNSHVQIALMLTRYSQKVLRKVLSHSLNTRKMRKAELAIFQIKPLFTNITVQTKPYCWSLISTDWRKPSFAQSLNVTVLSHKGFYEITPPSPYAHAKTASKGDRFDSFGGWRSGKGGSFIELSITIPKMARKTKKRTVGLLLRRLQSGKIKVWVGENENNLATITDKSYGRVGLQTRVYFLGEILGSENITKIKITTEARKTGFQVSVSGIVIGPACMKNRKEYKPTNTIQKVWSLEDYRNLLINDTKLFAKGNSLVSHGACTSGLEFRCPTK